MVKVYLFFYLKWLLNDTSCSKRQTFTSFYFIFSKTAALSFFQGSVAMLFRWSWKILSYFVANLSKTVHINFYQNRSSNISYYQNRSNIV